jgi:hypothetical protein
MPRNSDMLSSVVDISTRPESLAENLRRSENYLFCFVPFLVNAKTQRGMSSDNKTTEGKVTVMIHRRW